MEETEIRDTPPAAGNDSAPAEGASSPTEAPVSDAPSNPPTSEKD